MKIVNFHGGLGNQIFTYLFCQYLKRNYPKEHVYGAYWLGTLNTHQGLEIDRVFDVVLPPNSAWTDFLSKAYMFCKQHKWTKWERDRDFGSFDIVLDGNWLNQMYYKDEKLKESLPFKTELLNESSLKLMEEMKSGTSVAVHIRRGDYTSETYYQSFGQFSSKDYYLAAIERMKQMVPDGRFYFFSDDMEWVRENLKADNAVYVEFNKNEDSWQDLFLMSQCQHHIIANSTFSYWAAMLAKHPQQKVIAPKKWYVWDDPDIFPEEWERV